MLFVLLTLSVGALAAPSVEWKSFEVATPPMCGGLSWCATVVAPHAIRVSGFSSNPTVVDHYSAWGSNADTTVVVKCTLNPSGHMSVTLFSASDNAQSSGMWKEKITSIMLAANCSQR